MESICSGLRQEYQTHTWLLVYKLLDLICQHSLVLRRGHVREIIKVPVSDVDLLENALEVLSMVKEPILKQVDQEFAEPEHRLLLWF